MYRPEGFKNPYEFIPENNDRGVYYDNPEYTAFEAGADAMLEAIKKNGYVTSGALTNAGWPNLGKIGKWYYIPD